jgi:hypothetical protein
MVVPADKQLVAIVIKRTVVVVNAYITITRATTFTAIALLPRILRIAHATDRMLPTGYLYVFNFDAHFFFSFLKKI